MLAMNLLALHQLWLGFPGGTVGKESNYQCRRRKRYGYYTWVRYSINLSWKRKCQPTPVFLPGKSHGQRRLVGCSPWCLKVLDTTIYITMLSKFVEAVVYLNSII